MIKDLIYLGILGMHVRYVYAFASKMPTSFLVYVDTHQALLPQYKYGHTSKST
jgi:hypothetical protein